MYELLQLENFKDFSCIGGECNDTCCHSWRIFINKATYKKYKKNKNIKADNLIIIDKNNSMNYAEIKLKEDGCCPFLEESGLCNIHKNYGPSMLSGVCKVYPQSLVKFNDRMERSIKLSCPAGIDLLFKSEEPLAFDVSLKKTTTVITTDNEDLKINESFSNEDYFAFRNLAIDIIQCRELNIKERLFILGKVSFIVSNLLESKEYDSAEIRAYINELNETFKTEEMLKSKEEFSFKNDEKYELISKIIPLLKDFLRISYNKNKTNTYNIIKNGIENIDNISVNQIKNFKVNVLDKFFNDNQYIIEHYLVCKMFEEVFPKNSNSIENAFDLMVNKLLMLYLYIIVMYSNSNTITLDDFKNVLYFFERQLSHTKLKNGIINNLNKYIGADWGIILDVMF